MTITTDFMISSFGALEEEYAKAKLEVKKVEKELKRSKRKVNRYNEEPFKTERELQTAIKKWERRAEEIRKTRFFWTCGLLITIAGTILFGKCLWLGFSFIAAGLTQMIWWISPSFSYNEASAEYQRMLESKKPGSKNPALKKLPIGEQETLT